MIFGIGVDVLESAAHHAHAGALRRALHRAPADARGARAARAHQRPARFLAMRFAAKEAIVKAMGTGFAPRRVDPRRRRGAERLGQAGSGVLASAASACAAARHRRGPRDAHRRGGPGGRGRGADEGDAMNTPGVRHRDRAGRGARPAALQPRRPRRCAGRQGDVRPAPPGHRRRVPAARAAAGGRDLLRAAQPDGLQVWSLGDHELARGRAGASASSTASRSSRPTWCPGTARASTCRCCTYRGAARRRAGAALLGDRRRGHRRSATTTT